MKTITDLEKSKEKVYRVDMIASLKGTVTHCDSKYVVLDVGGVGYKVFLTDDALETVNTGSTLSLWIYMAVREDAMDLYGFREKKEKDFFELLIGISGIGPKSALNIMSLVSSDQLATAIRTGSTSHLVKVSGIGKKTAEKIVLELKDKLGRFQGESGSGFTAGMSSDMDAIEALRALGYDADEARDALKKVPDGISDTGAKVKAALKVLN